MLNHDNLVCLDTRDTIPDDGYVLANPNAKTDAFLRPVYRNKSFKTRDHHPGLYRFSDRLPINRILEGSASPITYQSIGLAEYLGLSELYITFNGYWPEKNARMTTGTFKECEAYSVCARMPASGNSILTVASAGNTARAFIKVCSENRIPLVVVVPEQYLNAIWAVSPVHPCVKIIAAGGDSDYLDAIRLSGIIASLPGFVNEGGAKNVARRAGMGTTVFSCVDVAGKIPDWYFQAIGSGTGAIAAYESNLQLIDSGGFGTNKMKLMLSQNAPFQPIADAWRAGERVIKAMSEEEATIKLNGIFATVLTNRNPPYAIKGGLFDVLSDTGGDVAAFSNNQAKEAMNLFEKTEGATICPESGIALAHLMDCVNKGIIGKKDAVMLNMTGGGLDAIRRDFRMDYLQPAIVVDKKNFNRESVEKIMHELL